MANANTVAAARAAYEAAKLTASQVNTQANREAVKAAWSAMEAVSPKQKISRFACRAGKRQAAERRAMSARRR